jgi:hypothetical protein
MKTILLLLVTILILKNSYSQNQEYTEHINIADSLYNLKKFKLSALEYSKAFETLGWKGYPDDRYNAACSWALANEPDSAFFQIDIVVKKSNYSNLKHITTDPDLVSLHTDKRWNEYLEMIRSNKEKAEVNLDKVLVAKLDTIYDDDQIFRLQIKEIETKFGQDSKEMKEHWRVGIQKDSVNLIKVKNILDTRGWLGADVIGEQGNTTLFLVIQHSDLKTQEFYLPMMREAVKKGNAKPSSLALLEDRIALRNGRMQTYGSQINRDSKTQAYYVAPLEDPDNVDKRRAEVGLQPLAVYVANWDIVWDVEQYKKDLPVLMESLKNTKQY